MRFSSVVCCLWLGCETDPAPEVAASTAACETGALPTPFAVHPALFLRPEHADVIRERIVREPYASIYDEILERAEQDYSSTDPTVWEAGANGTNAEIAASSALIAWLDEDTAAAEKARQFFVDLPTNWEDYDDWDINISMPHPLMASVMAWDLLLAAGELSDAESQTALDKLAEINGKFYETYVLNDAIRTAALGVTQNNHPIRTASAIGTVALAAQDHPDSQIWLDWAVSELDYLWGNGGRYVQADGGVSEGPFYYAFAFGPAVAFFIAMDNASPADRCFSRDCINRQDVEPWTDHGCEDGEPFLFDNPLHGSLFPSTVDWSISVRLPRGDRIPLADAPLRMLNGGALLTAYTGRGRYWWDWASNLEDPYETDWGIDLKIHHLAYFDDGVSSEPPDWTTRFFPAAGHAVMRSGWDSEDLFGMLVAEAGAARMTVHDHVDGTHFNVAAYGEYLLIDTGYYKVDEWALPETADAVAHNVILIDGQGAPDKGPLTEFGDTDAWLKNTLDGTLFDYAEAWQEYEETDVRRSFALVRDRYFVVADRLDADHDGARSHTWRVHGFAGYGSGGSYEVSGQTAWFERDEAGVWVHLASTDGVPQMEEPAYTESKAPHVHSFERDVGLNHHAVADGVVSGQAPGFLAILAPYRTGVGSDDPEGVLAVTAVEVQTGATAWLVETEAGTDLVWLREPAGPSTLALPDGRVAETDAELVVLGLEDGAALVARGGTVSLDGIVVVSVSAHESVAEQASTTGPDAR